MHRNSLTETSGRSMLQAVRMKLGSGMKINDNPMMQELDFGGMINEGRKLVERIQGFGTSSVPLPPIVKKAIAAASGGKSSGTALTVGALAAGSGASGGGGGGNGAGGNEEEAAEGIAVFLGGQRNHPVVIGVDDRRHRPMGMKPGESSQYDDAGQMTLIRRNGTYVLSTDQEDQDGNKPERMASLRHVEKDKQERKPRVPQKSTFEMAAMTVRQRREHVAALAQQDKDDQAKQDHKHEGKTVNTEVRVTKKKIEFYNGDQQVGEHDKASQKWNMKGKEFNASPSDATHINTKTVNITGSTGINVNGPTNINGSPVMTMATLEASTVIAALEARIVALEARIIEMGGG